MPEGSPVANYGFDVTPARLVSGLITERGVLAASRDALGKSLSRARRKRMIPKSGYRFPAFAKPASAGEGRSEKIMRHLKCVKVAA